MDATCDKILLEMSYFQWNGGQSFSFALQIQLQNVNIAHRLQKAPIPDATRKKLMDFLRGCPQSKTSTSRDRVSMARLSISFGNLS